MIEEIAGSKWIDYVPILSSIRGAYRIYIACKLKNNDHSISILAAQILKKDTRSPSYHRWQEIVRGIVSLLPGINLILIPWDLGYGLVMIVYHRFKPVSRLERLKTFCDEMLYLQSWYLQYEEIKKKYKKGHENQLVKLISPYIEFRIRLALKSATKNMRFIQGYVTPTYTELESIKHTIGRSDMHFDANWFYYALAALDDYYNKSRTDRHGEAYFIAASMDHHQMRYCLYLKKHCKTAIEKCNSLIEDEQKLQTLV